MKRNFSCRLTKKNICQEKVSRAWKKSWWKQNFIQFKTNLLSHNLCVPFIWKPKVTYNSGMVLFKSNTNLSKIWIFHGFGPNFWPPYITIQNYYSQVNFRNYDKNDKTKFLRASQKKNLISTNHCQNNWDCFTALVDIPKNFWSEPWKTANIIPVVIFESPYYHSLSLIIDYSPLLSPIMHWVYYSRVPNNRPRPILL